MVYVAQLFICARLGFHRKLLKYILEEEVVSSS